MHGCPRRATGRGATIVQAVDIGLQPGTQGAREERAKLQRQQSGKRTILGGNVGALCRFEELRLGAKKKRRQDGLMCTAELSIPQKILQAEAKEAKYLEGSTAKEEEK